MDKCSIISHEHTNWMVYIPILMIVCKYNYLIIPLRKFYSLVMEWTN